MIATNIHWDVRHHDFMEKFNLQHDYFAADMLEISLSTFNEMTEDEIHDLAIKYFDNASPHDINDFMKLPDMIDIPDNIDHDKESVSWWILNEYNRSVLSFDLKEDE